MTRALLQPSHLAVVAGHAVAALTAVYAVVLAVGLLTLPSPQHSIQDPWFTLMEVLILAIAPAALAFTVGVHVALPEARRPPALLAVAFMALCAGLTSAVHFAILVLSRLPAFAAAEWQANVFAFRWPSVVYALDILAWDVFFAAAAASLWAALRGVAGVRVARGLLGAAAVLSFAGLGGVVLGDMAVRNVGIVGYVVCFPVAAGLLARRLAASPTSTPG